MSIFGQLWPAIRESGVRHLKTWALKVTEWGKKHLIVTHSNKHLGKIKQRKSFATIGKCLLLSLGLFSH